MGEVAREPEQSLLEVSERVDDLEARRRLLVERESLVKVGEIADLGRD